MAESPENEEKKEKKVGRAGNSQVALKRKEARALTRRDIK